MGKISRGSRGIHGDTPATSQDQANHSCQLFYFVPGINLLEQPNLQRNPITKVLDDTLNRMATLNESNFNENLFLGVDTPNRISENEVTSQPAFTTVLS